MLLQITRVISLAPAVIDVMFSRLSCGNKLVSLLCQILNTLKKVPKLFKGIYLRNEFKADLYILSYLCFPSMLYDYAFCAAMPGLFTGQGNIFTLVLE